MKLKNTNAKNFIHDLKGRKVICFGAGTTLIEAYFEVRKIEKLEDYIAFFVDNDKSKHGLKFNYYNRDFDIKSVAVLREIDIKAYVLLITCTSYVEIYQQLKDIPEIRDLDCYMYNLVCSYPNLNVENFFINEIEKEAYKKWKQILEDKRLKEKHTGQRCFVIGNGPSLKTEDLELLKEEVTFGANRIFKLFKDTDWRPTYYICLDYLMYGLDHEEVSRIDSEIRFVPLARSVAAGKVYDEVTYYNRVEKYVKIEDNKITKNNSFDFSDNIEEVVYAGQTVLYDAIQFAVYMGFSEIYLLGVDNSYKLEALEDGTIIEHKDVKADHFNKEYDEGLKDAIAVVSQQYLTDAAFQKAREECERKGITIKNATRGGKLEVFDRISLEEVLE